MCSLRIWFFIFILLMVVAIPISAGDYHYGTNMVCADCHAMHYSLSHGYDGGVGQQFSGGPYERLLIMPVNDLCLSCHDGKADVPDVVGDNSAAATVRLAGALNKVSGTPNYGTWTGHTLGSTDTAPGSSWSSTSGLSCVDCHDPHGNTNGGIDVGGNAVANAWRNLRTLTSGGIAVSYAVGTNDFTKDCYEVSASGSNHYDISNAYWNEPDSAKSGIAEFCKQCHGDFHGNVGDVLTVGGTVLGTSATNLLRHPSAGVNIGGANDLMHSLLSVFFKEGKTNFVKVLAQDGKWGIGATQGTPTCLTCHKAHGNKNPFGLIYMAGTGAVTEQGDTGTSAVDTCKQCHAQGT